MLSRQSVQLLQLLAAVTLIAGFVVEPIMSNQRKSISDTSERRRIGSFGDHRSFIFSEECSGDNLSPSCLLQRGATPRVHRSPAEEFADTREPFWSSEEQALDSGEWLRKAWQRKSRKDRQRLEDFNESDDAPGEREDEQANLVPDDEEAENGNLAKEEGEEGEKGFAKGYSICARLCLHLANNDYDECLRALKCGSSGGARPLVISAFSAQLPELLRKVSKKYSNRRGCSSHPKCAGLDDQAYADCQDLYCQ